jgi:hypothetical protein
LLVREKKKENKPLKFLRTGRKELKKIEFFKYSPKNSQKLNPIILLNYWIGKKKYNRYKQELP